jgi:DNA polymerase/3'-5' exonuclease PolX
MQRSYINLMDELSYIMKNRKEFMRAKAYSNARDSIANFKGTIQGPNDVKGMPGIGKAIQEKIEIFTKTGTLPILDEERQLLQQHRAMSVFMDIYGVGEKKAESIINEGIYTIDELKKHTDLLNDKQRIGLAYYDDILKRIPRKEIDAYNTLFRKYYGENMEIVGSYRRGKPDSGDIDVILTGNANDYVNLINVLIEKKVILEVLSRGPTKCLVVAKLPRHKIARRVDFLFTSDDAYPFSLLYFTGSKEFNTEMRERALRMGYTLNEHGFSKMEGRKKGAKVDKVFSSEEEIFDFLKMKYKDPCDRTEGAIEDK